MMDKGKGKRNGRKEWKCEGEGKKEVLKISIVPRIYSLWVHMDSCGAYKP